MNHLSNENSPYLLQHSENPVDWYPWGPEALDKAQKENKPIFLSIGYAACHWCHVMAHESFEDPHTAAIMNQHFVNIKVDREERPDIDGIYMSAVVALTGQGGWPMSMFLTPDGRPFYGGTYFPPVRRYNMPSFQEVLLSVAHAWDTRRDEVLDSSQKITASLQGDMHVNTRQPISEEALQQAIMALAQNYDWAHGGWGGAPKFPQPMAIEFLLRRAERGDSLALEIACDALLAMSKGGMYDVVGGGFARYSTDRDWLIPHFEKMLYDNAQLARAYLHAYLLCRQKLKEGKEHPKYQAEHFRRVCEQTIDFIVREMTAPEGGFYSSLDADSEGEEGKYYIWTIEEIHQAVSDEEDQRFLASAYSIEGNGNFEGAWVLQQTVSDQELSARYGLSTEAVRQRLDDLHKRLLIARSQRVRPGTDDKILTGWNALMLLTISEAARYLDRDDYQEVAVGNARFLLSRLHPSDRLLRSWRAGTARHNAYLEDYAALILAMLSLYQTSSETEWYAAANSLADDMLAAYPHNEWGFFDTRVDAEPLITRPRDLQDNATPSGNALAAQALLELSALSGRGDLRDAAEEMVSAILPAAVKYPTAFSQWLSAADFALGPVKEVALVGVDISQNGTAMRNKLWETYRPRIVAAISPYPPEPSSPSLLEDRPLRNGLPTAYVCEHFSCQMPVTDAEELERLLR